MPRRGKVILLAVGTAVAAVASCSGSGQATRILQVVTVEDLTGAIWLLIPGDTMVSFHEDGRYRIDPAGSIAISPDYSGQFQVIGSLIQFDQQVQSSDGCPEGTTSSASVQVQDGSLELQWVAHSCFPQVAGESWSLRRVSPESVLGHEFPSEIPSTAFPARSGNLRGVWLVAGTSQLISFDGESDYVWGEGGQFVWDPLEVGTYSLTEETNTIQLRVRDSSSCQPGDVMRLQDAWMYSTPSLFRVLEASAQDECGRMTGRVRLVLISS